MKWVLRLVVFSSVVSATAIVYAYYWYNYSSHDGLSGIVTFNVPSGVGFSSIAHQLYEGGIIDKPFLYKVMVVLKGEHRQLKAGEYVLGLNLSPAEITAKLTSGDVVVHSITIPEGLTTAQIIEIIGKDARLDGEIPTDIAEGSLLPDTYHIQRNDSRADMIQRMQTAMKKAIEETWALRQADTPLRSPGELLTLASIVEKETGVASERARVAAVFVNRLNIPMKLQTDPTVIYAIERDKGPMERSLLRKDLNYDSPYNTYRYAGLPPGPICNPGRDALMAAAQPIESKELYFVATGTGGHRFAKTLAVHNRNVAAYRRVMGR